ncbi:hypothetical protein B0H10DRAFT_1964790 [Mycena sp. CBHHK59/15]|nr:hypothetical protein B0H10DRAFT_1964790 [Mycena sp. CBHHK59/15]
MSDNKLYTHLLLAKKLGYPLWYPQPIDSLPAAYRMQGTRIGDVGYVTPKGAFSFIFNICCPATDPVNCHFGVPAGFEHLDLDHARDVELMAVAFAPGSDISTETIEKWCISVGLELVPLEAGAGVELSCSSSSGTALLLPKGASSRDLLPLNIFKEYVLRHGRSWFKFLEHQGWPVNDLSLYLVTGCDKTAAWGAAAFSKSSGTGEVNMKFGPSPVAGQVAYSWDKTSYNYGFAHAGPHRQPGDEEWGENQSVFIHRYTVTMRRGLTSSLKGPVKLGPIQGYSSSQLAGSLTRISGLLSWASSRNTDSASVGRNGDQSPSESEVDVEYTPDVSEESLNFPDDVELMARIIGQHRTDNTDDTVSLIRLDDDLNSRMNNDAPTSLYQVVPPMGQARIL